MKSRILFRTALVIVLVAVAGCSSLKLRDANDQLTTYYFAKQQAQRADNYPMMENALASLNGLSARAAAQAAKERDVRNKIAFYRIAVTAAWQAGDPKVAEYGLAGERLCAGDTFAKAPRDCGMLAVVPSLASVDEQTRALDALLKKINSPTWQPNDADRRAADAVYDNYVEAFKRLVARRPSLQKSGAHPGFLRQVDRNLGALLCTQIRSAARGLLRLVRSPKADGVDADVRKMKCDLLRGGVDPKLAPCIQQLGPQDCG